MSQSTGVRRILPPLSPMSQAQAAIATSPSTRWTNSLAMSNWSNVSGSWKPRNVRFDIATGVTKTSARSDHHETLPVDAPLLGAGLLGSGCRRPLVSLRHSARLLFAAHVVDEAGERATATATRRAHCDAKRSDAQALRLQHRPALAGASAREYHSERLGHDLNVHRQVLMVHVDQVVLELALGSRSVAAGDLRQTGDSRLDAEALPVAGDLLEVLARRRTSVQAEVPRSSSRRSGC